MTPRVETWEESVGFLPHKVTAYEEPARRHVVYLRWRQDGNWRRRSLQRGVRTVRGRLDPAGVKWALEQAAAQYARLVAGMPAAERAAASPLTIRQGLAAAVDPTTGKYPTDTPHRREVERELARAIEEWGGDTPWLAIKRADLRKLWRRRIRQLLAEGEVGLRGAEVTVQRVNAVAAWLRDEELIPAGACVASRRWKQELAADWLELSGARSLPDPKRPRHTLDEMRRILAKSADVDPRFELAMAIGAELRLGQVVRCRRPDIDLDHETLTVRGKGQKKGTVVHLTDGQMRVVRRALTTGYLRELELAAADYPLFPAGPLPGGRKMMDPRATPERHADAPSVGRDVIDGWFHEAERLAEVPVIRGRAAYGLRRAAVDAVKAAGISREGLQAHGGWKDTQMPDRIYADQQMDYARDEAKAVRAKIRGEAE
jgi:integrase